MKNIAEIISKNDIKQSDEKIIVNRNFGKNSSDLTDVFNNFFDSLKVIFPASMSTIRTECDVKNFKKQWIKAFSENGITTSRQVSAGMRIARTQSKPFLPSVGQFIEWCHIGLAKEYNLPDKYELLDKFESYCSQRGLDDFDKFDYGSNENYWLISNLYYAMIEESLTKIETELRAEELILTLTKKLMNGFVAPTPKLLITHKSTRALSPQDSLDRLRKIKHKFGFNH